MCGIVGAVADRDIVPILIEGLQRLEYRGYDSAGVAVLNGSQQMRRLRTVGKVQKLRDALEESPAHGNVGIAHTRWATHGVPSERGRTAPTDARARALRSAMRPRGAGHRR